MHGKLSPAEEAHARSVGDTDVVLAVIPPAVTPRILIGSVIRKPAPVVSAFLRCLEGQQFRQPVQLSYHFITDFPAGDPDAPASKQVLKEFAQRVLKVQLQHEQQAGADFADTGATHQWTPQAWHRVGTLKNRLLQACVDGQYDAVWLVDADVLCDPSTLQSLLDAEVPIVAGVYWTHWKKPQPGDTQVVHAGPQVWLRHPYTLSGHGYTEADFRKALVERKLLRVWGLGACTLMRRGAIEKGVSFTPVPEGLPPGPLSDGEDRHFCERARRLHLPLYADAWPDIWHAYHTSEADQIPRWLDRFQAPRPAQASAPDLVSFRLELLEPVPHPAQPQMLQHIGPQIVRGRLAQLPVLPELANALAQMTVGERRLVTLHYPIHYPYATLRGQQRMVAVTLLDVKPYRLPPTIGEELFDSPASWHTADATTFTPQQLDSLLEEATVAAD